MTSKCKPENISRALKAGKVCNFKTGNIIDPNGAAAKKLQKEGWIISKSKGVVGPPEEVRKIASPTAASPKKKTPSPKKATTSPKKDSLQKADLKKMSRKDLQALCKDHKKHPAMKGIKCSASNVEIIEGLTKVFSTNSPKKTLTPKKKTPSPKKTTTPKKTPKKYEEMVPAKKLGGCMAADAPDCKFDQICSANSSRCVSTKNISKANTKVIMVNGKKVWGSTDTLNKLFKSPEKSPSPVKKSPTPPRKSPSPVKKSPTPPRKSPSPVKAKSPSPPISPLAKEEEMKESIRRCLFAI